MSKGGVKSVTPAWWHRLPSARYAVLFFAGCLLSTVVVHHWVFDSDPNKCQALVSEGHWFDNLTWVTPGCTKISYDGGKIKKCAGHRKRRITVIGDLHAQRLFFQIGRRLEPEIQVPQFREKDIFLTEDKITLQFYYDPYLNGSGLQDTVAAYKKGSRDRPLLTVIGAGNAHVEKGMVEKYAPVVKELSSVPGASSVGQNFSYDQGPGDLLLFTPAEEPWSARPDHDPKLAPYRRLNAKLAELGNANILWSFRDMIEGRKDRYKKGGVRPRDKVIKLRVDNLLNLRCNAKIGSRGRVPNQAVCCGVWRRPNWAQITFLSLGFAILPALILIDLILDFFPASAKPRVRALGAFAAGVSLQWITDRTHIFEQVTKLGLVINNFYLMIATGLLFGLASLQLSKPAATSTPGVSAPSQPFMPRDQSEEWKGWMQLLIIFYHYNRGWKNQIIWQVIRVTVASYLFLTGFGHTVFFLKKKDYSLKRFTNVMIRTNLLPVTLAYVMRTRWLSYYYMPLSTFNYVLVYVTMAFGRRYNDYTAFLLAKIAGAAFIVRTFVETENLSSTVVYFFRITCKLDWDSGEFFATRVGQDRYIVFIGMLAGLLYVHLRDVLEKEDRQDKLGRIVRKYWSSWKWSVIALLTIGHGYFWYWVRTYYPTAAGFRKVQPYTAWIPILSFLTLRNAHPTLRNWHSAVFAWLGKYSGEMYVMQNHLWLADDQEGILRTGLFRGNDTLLGDRWRDLLLLTPPYFLMCSIIGDATGVLAEWFIKEEPLPDPAEVAAANADRVTAEVEMGLLAGEELLEDCKAMGEEETTITPRWLKGEGRRVLPGRLWPRKLKHRVMLVLGIMWILNMTYT